MSKVEKEKFIGENLLRKHRIDYAPSPYFFEGQEIGTPFNLAQSVKRLGKEIIPDTMGVYHLFYEDRLIYVGMSKNLRGRLLYHMKDPKMPFNNVLWFTATEEMTIADVIKLEYKMIKRLMPPMNTQHFSINTNHKPIAA